MKPKYVKAKWIRKLGITGIVIFPFIFVASDSKSLWRHEMVHFEQQKKWFVIPWFFLYLFCLPVLWNPFRKKWEVEAYMKGHKLNKKSAENMLKKANYGWIIW